MSATTTASPATAAPCGTAPGSSRAVRYTDLVGRTPLLDLSAMLSPVARARGAQLLGKAEFCNPGFSMKDRIIQRIFDRAEGTGKLVRGSGQVVVCASSGNTGAACAMMCAARGYKAVVITNDKCSKEKMDAIRCYGAELRVARPDENYMTIELDLGAQHPDWFSVNQYECHLNSEAHDDGTGAEVWEQTGGAVTHFVAGGSTGGTITGVGRHLKRCNPATRVVLADPVGSVFHGILCGGLTQAAAKAGTRPFLTEGVGKRSVPGVFDLGVVDDVVQVSDQDAFRMCRRLAREEGLCVGGSAGMNVHAAVQLAERLAGGHDGGDDNDGDAEEPATAAAAAGAGAEAEAGGEADRVPGSERATEDVGAAGTAAAGKAAHGPPPVIVTILCDSGLKYLSKIYNDAWLQENSLRP